LYTNGFPSRDSVAIASDMIVLPEYFFDGQSFSTEWGSTGQIDYDVHAKVSCPAPLTGSDCVQDRQFVPYTVTGRFIEDGAAVGEGYIVSLSTTNQSEYTTTNADSEFEITAYGPNLQLFVGTSFQDDELLVYKAEDHSNEFFVVDIAGNTNHGDVELTDLW
jgi:hypothetical protein